LKQFPLRLKWILVPMKYDAQPKKGFSIVDLPNDNFITRIAKDAQEACEFIQVGFDYVIGEYDDGGKIFRKRK
jgi:glutathione peroxidase-family protein